MKRLIWWILPPNMWKGFRLDHRIYVEAKQNPAGLWQRYVDSGFYYGPMAELDSPFYRPDRVQRK